MLTPSKEFKEIFGIKADGKTDERFVFKKGSFRFSVLTSRLLRVEFDKDKVFTDEPTQAVFFRNIDNPNFKIKETDDCVCISTSETVFVYSTKRKSMESITLKDGRHITDFEKGNLKGTYRTLDMANGEVKLGKGLMSKNGVSVIDDSKTVILNSDGTIRERRECMDEYYFAYGRDYRGCLKDFFSLCGKVPLVPRYCLGNWWSRYKDYSQEEYISLMEKFLDKEIPITVATIDMDWHWVDLSRFDKKDTVVKGKKGFISRYIQASGWTGYSWNTDLFPDYKGFLNWLHEKGFKITMNLHPADGVRAFEDMYCQMAEKMGLDASTGEQIKFDFSDPNYIEAYFDVLHKPYEKDGVDFWWIDWQQEKTTKIKGLDPLWALNHYHTLAFNSENKRPLILSRFAEVGSHRYPLGFSGDTFITWKSLDFQPYFTLTASNIGYTWWSHDIGGHQFGKRDDELYARWVQLGQYSPIMRLHSTKDEFMGKEPWKYSFAAGSAAIAALRERHAMIPYLYSMNYQTHKNALALCEPMYYSYPEKEEAYSVKNQFFFGSELIVAPITTKINPKTNLAKVRVWLPKGRWTDIYNGNIYEGEKYIDMFRGIESIPVLAKEGAIIPLSSDNKSNNCKNPEDLTIRIFRGNNTFELYEDDGETMNFEKGAFAVTQLSISEKNSEIKFIVNCAQGDKSVIPASRKYTLIFEDIKDASEITVTSNSRDKAFKVEKKHSKVYVVLSDVKPSAKIVVSLKGVSVRENKNKREMIIDVLSSYQLETAYKKLKLLPYIKDIAKPFPINDEDMKGPVNEIKLMK